jgi:multisubunit Na+/H+ antiporter MnhB subunit
MGDGKSDFLRELRIINKKQTTCLWRGIAVIVLMGIFPPTPLGFIYEAHVGGFGKPPIRPIGYSFHCGYTFLLSAKASDIALNKLIIHWVIAGAVTFGLIYIHRDKEQKRQNFCLWAGIVVIVLMGIFPPARPEIPPLPRIRGEPPHYKFLITAKATDIAFYKLIIQWGIAGAVTSGLIYILMDKKAIKQKDE